MMALLLAGSMQAAAESPDAWVATVYGARISNEVGWEDIALDPVGDLPP